MTLLTHLRRQQSDRSERIMNEIQHDEKISLQFENHMSSQYSKVMKQTKSNKVKDSTKSTKTQSSKDNQSTKSSKSNEFSSDEMQHQATTKSSKVNIKYSDLDDDLSASSIGKKRSFKQDDVSIVKDDDETREKRR